MRALLLLLCSLPAIALESDYVTRYCEGDIEHVLPDRTRVDCLTSNHAIEYDFGRKWPEGLFQALYYAKETEKRAGVVLIVESESDQNGYRRAVETIKYYDLPIDVWRIENWQ